MAEITVVIEKDGDQWSVGRQPDADENETDESAEGGADETAQGEEDAEKAWMSPAKDKADALAQASALLDQPTPVEDQFNSAADQVMAKRAPTTTGRPGGYGG